MPYYLDLEIIPHRDYNYKRDSGNSAKSTNIIAAFHEVGVYGYYYRSELVVAEPGGEVSAQTTPRDRDAVTPTTSLSNNTTQNEHCSNNNEVSNR